jgi:hypothetical protein
VELPSYLLNVVREGRGVLLLGSGASFDSKDSFGNNPPSGAGLRDLLSDRFLGGDMKSSPLSIVAELAMHASSNGEVQDYIRQIFDKYHPTEFHDLIPSFVWKAIATANYDLVLERAYQRCTNAAQTLVPFVQNGEHIEERLRSPNSVRYLKLHGSISRTANEDAPLILTIDQYNNHRIGRDRLYSVLEELAYENPFIIAGHSLRDPDIRQVLGDVETRIQRPMSGALRVSYGSSLLAISLALGSL